MQVNEDNSNQEQTEQVVEQTEQVEQVESEDSNVEPQEISLADIADESIDELSPEQLETLIDSKEPLVVTPPKSTKEKKGNKNSNQSEVNDFTPPFDKEIFEKLPDSYRKIFKPIKANGQEITPSPEQMIQLIQLGSKYYADREAIKPKLELVQMLEKAGVTDKEILTQALDIVNGDEQAIADYFRSKGIDTNNIENLMEEEISYSPDSNKYFNAHEVALKEVDDQIKSSPSYDRVISTLESMDDESRSSFMENPEKILGLEQHMSSGLYDQINNAINNQKMFGQLKGLSYLEAYEKVGLEILSQNNQQPPVQQETRTTPAVAPVSIPASLTDKPEGNAPSPKMIDLNDEAYVNSLTPEELSKLMR